MQNLRLAKKVFALLWVFAEWWAAILITQSAEDAVYILFSIWAAIFFLISIVGLLVGIVSCFVPLGTPIMKTFEKIYAKRANEYLKIPDVIYLTSDVCLGIFLIANSHIGLGVLFLLGGAIGFTAVMAMDAAWLRISQYIKFNSEELQ